MYIFMFRTHIHIYVHIYVLSTAVHLDTHEWYMSDRLDISVVCNYYTWSLSNGPVLHCQKVSWNHHHQYIFNIILFNNKIIVIISSDSCIVFFTNVFFQPEAESQSNHSGSLQPGSLEDSLPSPARTICCNSSNKAP